MSKLKALGVKQKEAISKFLLDIAKIVIAVFVIGGLVPGSPVTGVQMVVACVDILVIIIGAIWLIREDKDVG